MLTIENINDRIALIENFIESGEYKKYKNWKETPLKIIHAWITSGTGKKYLTKELKVKINRITYFKYKCTKAVCPYETKDGHHWCKHCETEKLNNEFRGKNICKECALKYRQDTYYETGRIQSRINYHTSPLIKLNTLCRVYILGALNGSKKSKRTKDIVGLEWNELKEYIESKFEPWMNWDNHGHGEGSWVIQHIIPKILAKNEHDVYRINYYKNLIPWGYTENSKFKDKILINQLNEWHYTDCKDLLLDNEDKIRIEMEPCIDEMGNLFFLDEDLDLFMEHEKQLGRKWKSNKK